jgi:hypothetical protein
MSAHAVALNEESAAHLSQGERSAGRAEHDSRVRGVRFIDVVTPHPRAPLTRRLRPLPMGEVRSERAARDSSSRGGR